ncbi:MAG: DUF2071 domain-containing protein [Methanoregulaceae archaeon]|nr:DUF2071 domain-containing protein [Methanoregulaceae archaeon]
MSRPFLTAEWRNLILVNWAIDPQLLKPLVPTGTELDFHEGHTFISLVAFEFLETRVRGLALPGHRNFIEVNLRFYVRRVDRRGVVFIKELVPRPLIAWVARTVYGEPYETWTCEGGGETYRWGRGAPSNRVAVQQLGDPALPTPGSHAEFITEHYWGYTRRSDVRTDEYWVDHPQWEHRAVGEWNIDVDFAAVYGPEWGFLAEQEPASVLYAVGSEVAVYPGERLG